MFKVTIFRSDGTTEDLTPGNTKEQALLELNKADLSDYSRVYLEDPDGNPNLVLGSKKKKT